MIELKDLVMQLGSHYELMFYMLWLPIKIFLYIFFSQKQKILGMVKNGKLDANQYKSLQEKMMNEFITDESDYSEKLTSLSG